MKFNKIINFIYIIILSSFTINNFAMEEKSDNNEIKNETLNNNSSYFSRFKAYFSNHINPKSIYNKIKNGYSNMKNYISNYVNNNNKYAKYTLLGLGSVALVTAVGYKTYKYWKNKNINSESENPNDKNDNDIDNLIEECGSDCEECESDCKECESTENDNFFENKKKGTDDSQLLENNEFLEYAKSKIFIFISENLGFLSEPQMKIIDKIVDNPSYLESFIAKNENFPYSDKSTEDNIEILVTFFQNKFLENNLND